MTLFGTRTAELNGLRLVADLDEEDDRSTEWIAKATDALSLIETVSPVVAARLRRNVRRVVISGILGPDYAHEIRAIRLHGPALDRQDAELVARTIVHEAAHAHIAQHGIPYTRNQRARHERVATRCESRFVHRLTGDPDRAMAVMQKLDEPWWTNEAMVQRRLLELQAVALPESLKRVIGWLIVWRGRL